MERSAARLAAFAALLTPIEAAALTAALEADRERLGPPRDVRADLGDD